MPKAAVLAVLVWLAPLATAYAQAGDFWAGVTADAVGQAMSNSSGRANEARCLAGEFAPSERQLSRIREGAQTTMVSYFELVGASDIADVSDVFSRRQQVWRLLSDQDSKVLDLSAVSDPLARAAAAPLSAPDAFFRSGDGRSAAGLWTVRHATESDRVIGYYRAAFRRERGQWRLESLELGGPENAPSLTPYCHGIGDIDAHLAELARAESETPAASADAESTAPNAAPGVTQ